MWTENFHYHEFILGGQVYGSIKVNRDNFEISVNGNFVLGSMNLNSTYNFFV